MTDKNLRALAPDASGEFLLYQTEVGQTRIDVRLSHDTIWVSDRSILPHAGKISHEVAKEKADTQFERFSMACSHRSGAVLCLIQEINHGK